MLEKYYVSGTGMHSNILTSSKFATVTALRGDNWQNHGMRRHVMSILKWELFWATCAIQCFQHGKLDFFSSMVCSP